jgi:hypothetical protein
MTAQTPQLGSQQRDWWETHEYLEAYLAQANLGPIPAAGTPNWCALEFSDPRKLLALAIDGEHHVLRCEVAQRASCDASSEISAAADWGHIGRHIRQVNEFYEQKPYLRRVAS